MSRYTQSKTIAFWTAQPHCHILLKLSNSLPYLLRIAVAERCDVSNLVVIAWNADPNKHAWIDAWICLPTPDRFARDCWKLESSAKVFYLFNFSRVWTRSMRNWALFKHLRALYVRRYNTIPTIILRLGKANVTRFVWFCFTIDIDHCLCFYLGWVCTRTNT